MGSCFKYLSDNGNELKPARANRVALDYPLYLQPFYRLVNSARVGAYLLTLTKIKADNAMKKPGLPNKYDGNMYFLDPVDLQTFNLNRKLHNSTIVNTLHAILAQAMHDYMLSQGQPNTKEVTISSTICYKNPPKNLGEVEAGNSWYPNPMPLKMSPNLQENLQSVQKMQNAYASKQHVLGYNTVQFWHNLPFDGFYQVYLMCSQATTFGFSSIPGPPDGYCFHGMKSKGMWGFYPCQGEQLNNMLMTFMDGNLRLSMQLEKNYVEHPKLFLKFYDQRMKEFLQSNQPEQTEVLSEVNYKWMDYVDWVNIATRSQPKM